MCDALKSNTTLTKLHLNCEHKRNNTQKTFINNQLFSIHIKSTGNYMGCTGATSLSDALKSNKTLSELNLSGKHKRNNTEMTYIDNSLFSIPIKSTENNIEYTGATSLSYALKSNTTLTELYLHGEDKRNNTQMTSINKPLFSIHIN